MMILKIVLAIIFFLAGGAKIAKAKPLKNQFEEFGLSILFMQVIGVLEILGGVGILLSSLSLFASVGLGILMIGAIANHLKVKHAFSLLAPSLFLFIGLIINIYLILA